MKKFFLIVAVLMLATPALAVPPDVYITARAGDDANVEIWYEVIPAPNCPSDGNRPRAFGLNIIVTDGNIIDINVPFEGECDDVNRGYGIFPGTITIEGGEVTNYGTSGYTPVAPDDAPGAEDTGLDTNTIVIEMGSLYTDDNCPDPCAMLFTFTVSLDCNVTIVGNAARTGTASPEGKGVVLENLKEVIVNFPEEPFKRRGVSRWVPDVVGKIQADACDAIEANDLVVGDITWECNETYLYDYVIGQDPPADTEVKKGSSVHLVKSLGACDFGDADDPPYPTLLANNGAVHVATGVILGVFRDTEPDGQPSPNADLDDNTGAPDDEDGVVFVRITPVDGNVIVTVDTSCYLNAWMDFNDNGDWDDPGEQIFTDELLAVGPNPLTFAVPAGALTLREIPLISRWRVNDAGGLDYTGLEDNGEVEDYNTGIVCHVPDVNREPNLVGQATIIANGFTIGNVTSEYSDTVADGNVISTNPAYCNYPGCDTAVDIVVSKGSCHVPDVVGEPNLAAQAEIIANGFTIGNVTAECNDTIADGNVISTNPAYCNYPGCDTAVDIVVSTGPCAACEVPNVIDMTQADACDAIVAAGYVLGAVTESNDCGVVGDFNVISSTPAAGATPECGSAVDIEICECYYGQADYAVWEAVGKPICWCYPRQCHGDADGKKQGGGLAGYRYVDTDDLNILSAGWLVKEPLKGPGIASIPNGACADFAHNKQGGGLAGYRYVDTDDLDILSAYWLVKEPLKGPGTPDDCKPGNRTPAP